MGLRLLLDMNIPPVFCVAGQRRGCLRHFHATYAHSEKLSQLAKEIDWGHNTVGEEQRNPSIGIISKSKYRSIVEYTAKESDRLMGVSTYRLVSALPRELQGQLPAPDQVASLLDGVG